MVFKHNKQPFDHDDSCQLAFKHTRQLDCSGQLAISACRHIPERQQIPDGVRPGGGSEFENVTAVTPSDNSGSALGNTSSLSWVICSNGEIVRSEHSKRPFSDDQSYQVASKRTRQLDGNIPPFSSTCEGSFASVTADEEFESRKDAAVPENFVKNSHGSIFSLPWFTCSTSEEDTTLEPPVRLSFFPGYYEDHHRAVGSNQLEETHSPVFDYPPRRLVALGRNHQADVPVWRSKCFKNSYRRSDDHDASISSADLIGEDNSDKWTGSCVMPMPDSNSLASKGQVGCCKADCCCLDEGSIRCVRQHVMEAREKLRSTLGHERFVELGFCDMGEGVALKWTEEEEQLFHEVVLSNPASLGKNFWDDLPRAFPSRSSKELVSYYFNVFMLRKRAEQNRSDPLNVDSDNDEWQESDDGEFAMTEEDDDEDSGVESPTGDDITQNNDGLGEVNIHEEAEEGDDCDDEDYGVSDGFIGDNKSKFGPHAQPRGKNLQDGVREDQDIHDDSCTSYEDQYNGADSSGGRTDALEGTRDSLAEDDHENLHAEYRNDGLSGMTDHEYIVGHCDSKSWEINYILGAEKDLDFLPTSNVIEEVFGNESWEGETRDSHGVR